MTCTAQQPCVVHGAACWAAEPEVCELHQRRYWQSPEGPWCPLCEDDPPEPADLLAMLAREPRAVL